MFRISHIYSALLENKRLSLKVLHTFECKLVWEMNSVMRIQSSRKLFTVFHLLGCLTVWQVAMNQENNIILLFKCFKDINTVEI